MFIALLELKEMPATCWECPMYNLLYKNCHILDRVNRAAKTVDVFKERRSDCPLKDTETVVIGETKEKLQ